MKITKDQTLNVSLSAIVSLITVGAAAWLIAKPIIADAVAGELKEEMREQIEETVQAEVSPIKTSQIILLEQQILQAQRQIAQLERLRDASPAGWSSEQANALVDLRSQLAAQQMALAALRR